MQLGDFIYANMRISAFERLILRQQSAQLTVVYLLQGGLLRHRARLSLLNKLPHREVS